MAKNECWGIDIGCSSIRAIKMSKDKNQLKIVAVDEVTYNQNIFEEDVDAYKEIQQALSKFKTRNKAKRKDRIFVSLESGVFDTSFTIPIGKKRHLSKEIARQAQQQIPFCMDEVIWDYQIFESGQDTKEKRVIIFAARKELINDFVLNLKAVGIVPLGIQEANVAMYNFIKFEHIDLKTGIFIDIRWNHTNIVICNGEKWWRRSTGLGGYNVLKFLQSQWNISYQEFCELELRPGRLQQDREILKIAKPIFIDIIGYFSKDEIYMMLCDVEKIVLMGYCTNLSLFQELLQKKKSWPFDRAPCEKLSELKKVQVSPKVNCPFQTTFFAVAVGLALQGLGEGTINTMLLPSPFYSRYFF